MIACVAHAGPVWVLCREQWETNLAVIGLILLVVSTLVAGSAYLAPADERGPQLP